MCRMALNCPLEHTAYVFYLLFEVIWSFRVITGRTVMVMILDPETTKARSSDFDVMVWIAGAKAIEAQCQKCAVVLYEAWISSNEEDQK
jgi:hypothetical protein